MMDRESMGLGIDNFCCPVCEAQKHTVLMDKQVAHPLWWLDEYPQTLQLRYVLCDACGYICLRPHLSVEEYDAIYRHSPGLDRQTIKEARDFVLLDRKAFIDRYASELVAGTVVEAGPAYGDFLNLFSVFKRRVGIEPSATYRDTVAQETPALDYYPYVLEEFVARRPEFNQAADLVLACHVLEHAFDPKVFVNNLAALSKKGAYVYIEVPSIEGMAETQNPLYQNLYYGHVSQFSVPVITRLGVDCGLMPVKVIYSASNGYPVIRALFRKALLPEDIAAAFTRHSAQIESRATSAQTRLLGVLHDPAVNDAVIWGCGQDLLDLLLNLNDEDQQLFKQKITLLDRNPGKQGREFFGKTILSPADVERADAVLIATHSQILSIDIARDIGTTLPGIPLINLYDLLPE